MTNTIALYGCNFGNYRDELNNGIDDINICDGIDYYFFTDNVNLKSTKWKIIIIPLYKNDINIMDYNRWTNKYVKFILPDILKKYDIVIWCDSKVIYNNNNLLIKYKNILNNFNKNNILEKMTNYKVLNLKHPIRKTPQEELIKTINSHVENRHNGTMFLRQINKNKFNLFLPNLCMFIRKTDDMTNKLFEYTFQLLKEKGLKRDQNVYNVAAVYTNMEQHINILI
jgi:hypothetical protein